MPAPGPPPLIGRERELSDPLQRLERSRGGDSPLVLAGGEPRLANTRLRMNYALALALGAILHAIYNYMLLGGLR